MKTVPITIDTGTAYGRPAPQLQARADRGRRRHADGRAAAPLLAPDRPGRRCQRHAAPGARARRRPGAVSRQERPAGSGVSALHAPRRVADVRQGRGARHPLLLPRLAVRRAGPLPGAAVRAQPRRAEPHRRRQPWYPVQELYGMVWAYMGPPDRKPVLPRYERAGGAG